MVKTEETNVDNWTVLMLRTGDREYIRIFEHQDSLNGEDRGQKSHPQMWTTEQSQW